MVRQKRESKEKWKWQKGKIIYLNSQDFIGESISIEFRVDWFCDSSRPLTKDGIAQNCLPRSNTERLCSRYLFLSLWLLTDRHRGWLWGENAAPTFIWTLMNFIFDWFRIKQAFTLAFPAPQLNQTKVIPRIMFTCRHGIKFVSLREHFFKFKRTSGIEIEFRNYFDSCRASEGASIDN